jgi:hypothetical protein
VNLLCLEYALGTNPKKNQIKVDNVACVPLPPFKLLFSQAERAVMTLLLQCQRNRKKLDSIIQLGSPVSAFKLPQPFKTNTLENWPITFPITRYSVADAEYILAMMAEKRSIVPYNYGLWIGLASLRGMQGEDNEVEMDGDSNKEEDRDEMEIDE